MIIYQAGADAHCEDPLGGILTNEELMERDRKVFQIAKDLGVGIAWTLAGGYQRDRDGGISRVVEIHLNTFRAALEVQTGDCNDHTSSGSDHSRIGWPDAEILCGK